MENSMFSKPLITLTASLIFATSALASARLIVVPDARFAQPDGKKHAVKAGIVAGDGSIVSGTGYSVSHDGTGEYTIDIPAGTFPGCPAIMVIGAGVNAHAPIADVYNYITCGSGEVKAQIRMYSNSGSGLQDNAFHFVMNET
jgi:hypothetical protein